MKIYANICENPTRIAAVILQKVTFNSYKVFEKLEKRDLVVSTGG